MIAQQHQRLVAEVGDQPVALVVIEGDPLIVVVREPRQHDQRMLAQRQQALGLGGDRDALVGVQMHDEVGILARGVDRRMDGESGRD